MSFEQYSKTDVEYKFNYFYKITNRINGKYYYGIHSTDDLDDGYMGSGITLRKDISKCGKQNFNKEIIKFFDTREELKKYESEFVTEDLIKDKKCYNRAIGGTGGRLCDNQVLAKDKNGNIVRVYKNDNRLFTGELVFYSNGYGKTEDIKRKLSESVTMFYDTEQGKVRKEEISKERDIYWNSEEGKEMKKWLSEHNKAYYASEEGKETQRRRVAAITGRDVTKETREKHSKSMKKFWNTERGMEVRAKYSSKRVCTEHKPIVIPKYDLYEMLDDGTLKPVLTDAKRIDLVKHFGVKGINVKQYVEEGKPYRSGGKKYKIEKRNIHSMSVHTYRPSEIQQIK